MRNTYLALSFGLLFCLTDSYSQSGNLQQKTLIPTGGKKNIHTKWKANPFDHQVFILNQGQFDGAIPGNEKILYGAQLGKIWAYFTSHSIVYCYKEFPKKAK